VTNLREAAELYLETLKPAERRRLSDKTILASRWRSFMPKLPRLTALGRSVGCSLPVSSLCAQGEVIDLLS